MATNQEILNQAEAALLERLQRGTSSVTVAGRSVTSLSLNDLRSLVDEYRRKVRAEQRGSGSITGVAGFGRAGG